VSRGSPGIAEFSSVSQRSSRVWPSPIDRAKSVIADGPPMVVQQHVGRGVVTALQRRPTQLGQRHPPAGLGAGHRRMADHRSGIDVVRVGQLQLATLRHLQDPPRRVHLERRAHREHVAIAVSQCAMVREVHAVQADERVVPPLQQPDPLLDRWHRPSGVHQSRTGRRADTAAGCQCAQRHARDEHPTA